MTPAGLIMARVLTLLGDGCPHTTPAIVRKARVMAVSTRKAELAAHRRLTVGDVAEAVAALPPVAPAAPVSATVIRLLFDAPRAPVAAPIHPDAQLAQQAVIADMTARRARKMVVDDAGRETFARARDLERQVAAGTTLTKDQQVWLNGYQSTPDYRAWTTMLSDFGEEVLTG